MGPGRKISKQSLRTKTKSLVVQSILDSRGNIFIKRKNREKTARKQQELLSAGPKQGGGILKLSSKLLRLSRLNKTLLVLIVVSIFILYANLEHLVRKANFAFLLPSISGSSSSSPSTYNSSSSQAVHKQHHYAAVQSKEEQQQKQTVEQIESRDSVLMSLPQQQQAKPLKFLPQQSFTHNYHNAAAAANASHKHVVGGHTANDYNIFVIYTKENYQLHAKFELFTRSLLKHTSIPLHLHVITDRTSKNSVEDIIHQQMRRFRRTVIYTLYDVQACAEQVVDIVSTMRQYFSASPKSYYSDALFYLSLGLHRIADENLDRVVLLDCDIVFRSDVRQLFAEFGHFSDEHLFGLAPELTPVYRHILYRYRVNYPGTNFGNPYYPMRLHSGGGGKGGGAAAAAADKSIGASLEEQVRLKRRIKHGYPGLNSGVVLLQLARIRTSQLYNEQLMPTEVKRLTTKYSFRGHLGDQDFYTIFGYEFPHLIYRLDCVWNRQLCTYWKNHGYSEVFDAYFHCEGRIRMYHGNCNTRVPE